VSSTVLGDEGGFNLEATAGTLTTTDSNVDISTAGDQAVHNNEFQRSWTMDWTAPAKDTGTVTIYVAGMTSDGSGSKNSGDWWNTASYSVTETPSDSAPSVTVTQPNGNENYNVDSTITVQWTATDDKSWGTGTNCWVYYDTDTTPSGQTLITSGNLASTGTYDWDTTGVTAGDYYIHVVVEDSASQQDDDYSDASFSIIEPNNAPTLGSGAVTPTTGETTTTFTYTVIYTDADNDAPDYVRVIIDSGSPATMSVDTSAVAAYRDGDYTNGEQYVYSTTLSAGSHNFYFEASDSVDTARDPSTGAHSGPSVTAPPTGPAKFFAISENTVSGSTIGDYTDTWADDGTSESLTEHVISKGKKSKRTSLLEHKWTFSITANDVVEFNVEASAVTGEVFEFSYSIDDVYYMKMLSVDSATTGMQTFEMPNPVPGTIYVMVTDTDRAVEDMTADTIDVDYMYITSYQDASVRQEDRAASDVPMRATVANTYFFTHASDDNYQEITERKSGGKPVNRYSFAEHQWTFDLSKATTFVFYVEALRSANAEGDNFEFSYSTDGVIFTPMTGLSVDSDVETTYSYSLPTTLSGTIYIMVEDTDSTPGNIAFDTLYVDYMAIA
jgi:hypothetical protein